MEASLKEIWAHRNYRYSIIIALLLVIWLATGLFTGNSNVDDEPRAEEEAAPLTEVRVRQIAARNYPLRVMVKGRTEADRTVDVKAEITGQVEEILVERGELVKAGDAICRLALEDRDLLLKEAEAAVAEAKLEYDGALRLKTDGFQSETEIAEARARLETTQAMLLRRKINREKTAIRAPFDGLVDERPVEVGTLMRPGDTCATILDMDPLVITGQVSEADVANIQPQTPVVARLSTGEKLHGQIRYVSRRANDVTRTFRVEAAVNNPGMRMFSHVTTELTIDTHEVPAHLISSSLLMLDDEGKLGLRLVDRDNQVRFYNVDIVGDADEGVWVTGLPETATLITVGQEYVGNGEQVKVVADTTTTSNTKLSDKNDMETGPADTGTPEASAVIPGK